MVRDFVVLVPGHLRTTTNNPMLLTWAKSHCSSAAWHSLLTERNSNNSFLTEKNLKLRILLTDQGIYKNEVWVQSSSLGFCVQEWNIWKSCDLRKGNRWFYLSDKTKNVVVPRRAIWHDSAWFSCCYLLAIIREERGSQSQDTLRSLLPAKEV